MILTGAEDACPACDERTARVLLEGSDRLYWTTTKVFQVVECAGCRLIRLFPWPKTDELGSYYPPDYWFKPAGSFSERLEERYRRFVLRDHIHFASRALRRCKETGRILDVGCGGGLFLRMMQDAGAEVTGLDFSADAARIAWHSNAVPVAVGALPRAPFEPSSFAMITMFHVLEHLYDPMAYLEAAHRLLRPDGRLVVQVPNAACWQFLLLGENWSGVDIPRHLINFRDKDLDLLLEHAGFEVLRHKHFNLRDNPAAMATSLAPGLDPMARRVRGSGESTSLKILKDSIYMAMVMASIPFAFMEAVCRAGATIMVEARKKR